jgi:hypothetical protein
MTTPNMGLAEPTDHGSSDVWGSLLNTIFDTIDAHDHTTGKGVKVPTAGLNINADLTFSSAYAITNALALDMAPVAATGVTGYSSALFTNSSDANNLYFRNASGVNVKITDGSTLNVSITGGIGGDYSSIGALLDYDDASDTYRFRQQTSASVRQYAKVAHGDIALYEYKAAGNATVPTNAVTLKSPSALASAYSVIFPSALPGSQLLLQMDASGNLVASNTLPSGTNLTFQGAGKVIHGAFTVPIPLLQPLWSTSAGTASASGGTPGTALSTSYTGYYPLHLGLKTNEPITGFKVYWAAAPGGSVTYDIAEMDSSSGTFSAKSIGGSSSSQTPSFTFAAQTPLTGDTFWLKVVTPGGASGTVLTVELTQQG